MNRSLSSNFSNVVFHDIPESYGIAETVTFQYTISSDLQPSANDWIGLYRVGWKSVKEYVTYEWVTLPDGYAAGAQVECVCTFKDNIPKNDEDFFQFCYINSQSKVCGASSPFQFLEDYDIIVISEMESMLIVEKNAGQSIEPTATEHQQPCSDELVIVVDEVERLNRELMETKSCLTEKDSQLKDLESEVDWLKSKLKTSEDLSSQLTEDVDRLKSDLLDEKERQIRTEKSFSESEKHYKEKLLKFSERELAYKAKQMQLTVAVEDTQKQLLEKAQELELLKMDHASNLSVLNVKQLTLEELTKRCSRMSAEIIHLRNISRSEAMRKDTTTVQQEQIRHVQATSKDEKRTNEVVLEKRAVSRRNTADDELVTDGMEASTGATAEGGVIRKKLETDSCSTDQSDGSGSMQSKKTCGVCSLMFPGETSAQVIEDHRQSHRKVCPMCNEHLDLNCTQQDFEMHVSEHLKDTIRVTDACKVCPVCNCVFPSAYAQDMFEVHVNQHFTDTRRPNYVDFF